MISFYEFREIYRMSEATGAIKTSTPLDDYDLLVQWAVARIGEKRGYPCEMTLDEIWHEMGMVFEEEPGTSDDLMKSLTKQMVARTQIDCAWGSPDADR